MADNSTSGTILFRLANDRVESEDDGTGNQTSASSSPASHTDTSSTADMNVGDTDTDTDPNNVITTTSTSLETWVPLPKEHEKVAESILQNCQQSPLFQNATATVALIAGFLEQCDILKDSNDGAKAIYFAVASFLSNETLKSTNPIDATKGMGEDSRERVIQVLTNAKSCAASAPSSSTDLNPSVLNSTTRKTFVQFSGQGGDFLIDLIHAFKSSPLAKDLIVECIQSFKQCVQSLAPQGSPEEAIFSQGVDVLQWIDDTSSQPTPEYLSSAPISMPLIAITQFANIVTFLDAHGITFNDVVSNIAGATGHSQGIAIAAVMSVSTNYTEFKTNANVMVKTLTALSFRCQQVNNGSMAKAKQVRLPPYRKPKGNNGNTPEPDAEATVMLAVIGLTHKQIKEQVNKVNKGIVVPEAKLHIGLFNGPTQVVVSGAPGLLTLFRKKLGERRIAPGDHQPKTPFSKRLLDYRTAFLPMSVPFHHPSLAHAIPLVMKDIKRLELQLTSDTMTVPVFSTNDGNDLVATDGLLKEIVSLLAEKNLNYPAVTDRFVAAAAAQNDGKATSVSVLDFGPGAPSNSASLTARNTKGSGVNVIMTSIKSLSYRQIATKPILNTLDSVFGEVSHPAQDWRPFAPRLIQRKSDKRLFVSTRQTTLLGKPPLIVAGMTPTTSIYGIRLVAACANAGYHVELAGGGLSRPAIFKESIIKLTNMLTKGASFALNLLYLNAKQWGFQFKLACEMRAQGYPIESITIGAGVPSTDVAQDIIEQMHQSGMRYLSFKPGSRDAISSVLGIATANPHFPIAVQWTGGRGGGHHSYEDVHEPILNTYAALRRLPNVILVFGSGFGDGKDSYQYLSGEWSTSRGYCPMPFDAILLASRLMVSREASTATAVKDLICATPGIPPTQELDWEKSYSLDAGGIITVKSELGEPIHKIANRGMQLWREFDQKYFSLARGKERNDAIEQAKPYIIKRINADFQKLYFGKKASGEVVDVSDMTYEEVLNRMVELMFVSAESDAAVDQLGLDKGLSIEEVRHEDWTPNGRWLHPTFRSRVVSFMHRAQERYSPTTPKITKEDLDVKPLEFLSTFFLSNKDLTVKLLTEDDLDYWFDLCQTGGKPVNFVPLIDGDLSIWFKKDSLWYSEDLAAVPDFDADRVCILQGPISTYYNTVANEPVADILNHIHSELLESTKTVNPAVTHQDYLGFTDEALGLANTVSDKVIVTLQEDVAVGSVDLTVEIDRDATANDLPSQTVYLQQLTPTRSWLRCFLQTNHIGVGSVWSDNYILRLLTPQAGNKVQVKINATDHSQDSLKLYSEHPECSLEGTDTPVVCISLASPKTSLVDGVQVIESATIIVEVMDPLPTVNHLKLNFKYDPTNTTTPITQVSSERLAAIKLFYKRVWLNGVEGDLDFSKPQTSEITLSEQDIKTFNESIHISSDVATAPLDLGIMACWQPLIACLFHPSVTGSFLDLVHLGNEFDVVSCDSEDGVHFKRGDKIVSAMDVISISNAASGQTVVVSGPIENETSGFTLRLTSSFLFRGDFSSSASDSFASTNQQFTFKVSEQRDADLLNSKPWINLDDADKCPFEIDMSLIFHVYTQSKGYGNSTRFETSGDIFATTNTSSSPFKLGGTSSTFVGVVDPVADFFSRVGSGTDTTTFFENGGYLVLKAPPIYKAPTENRTYSISSKDYNPIHRNPFFAGLASLPDTIVHGMWTSAATRKSLCNSSTGIDRVQNYNATYVGMVNPSDTLTTDVRHVGMKKGNKVMEITTRTLSGEKAVTATATVETESTAYVFTGQGSAEVNMGMKLYSSSKAAKAVWDLADRHLLDTYGFSILDIVKNNPKQLQIHFGGRKGTRIRKNYIALQTASLDGKTMERLIPEIGPKTASYTFKSPTGLLFSTQFTQCALVLQEKSIFEDLIGHDLVPSKVTFAGHSLGEYACLTASGDILAVESLVEIVFLRGLVMQRAVPRDNNGRSDYGMVAANPTRVGMFFTEELLHKVVDGCSEASGELIQVVNYNVKNLQYVVAGHVVALETLRVALNMARETPALLKASFKDMLATAFAEVSDKLSKCKQDRVPFTQERGTSTIPLPGIDVPFHSRYLMSGVPAFRECLKSKIDVKRMKKAVKKLAGCYVPNVTAAPFYATKDYVQMTFEQTKSPYLKDLLDSWDKHGDDEAYIAYTLVIELLAYQFASPVRWIETVDHMLKSGVKRFIEVGPAPTLTNMMMATLKGNPQYGSISNFEVLFCERDEDNDAIYFNHEDAGPDSATVLEKHLEEMAQAEQDANPKKAISNFEAPPPVIAPAQVVAAVVPQQMPQQTVTTTPLAPLEDIPASPELVIRVIVSLKTKKGFDEVTAKATVNALSGGKSALQNEIIGEVDKEFGNSPDNAAEMTIEELAKTVGAGYSPMGPVSNAMIGKLVSTKMPGGFGMNGIRAHLSTERTLGPQRMDAVLLFGLSIAPSARLDSEAAANAWLDQAADGYGSTIGETIPRASQVSAATSQLLPMMMMGAPPPSTPAAAPVADEPVSSLQVLRVLLGTKLGKSYTQIAPNTTLKELVGGKSAVQNEIMGDFEKEFPGVPENAAEMPLEELSKEIAVGYTPLGPVSKGMVDKLVAAKMPGGFGFGAVREHLAQRWNLGNQRIEGVVLYALTMQPSARLGDEAATKAWLDSVTTKYAEDLGVNLSGGGGGGGGHAQAVAVGGPAVASADLKALLLQLKDFVNAQLDAGHQYLGIDAMEVSRKLETEIEVRKTVETQLSNIEEELGDYFIGGIEKKFSARKLRVFDSYWNWAKQETLSLILSLMRRDNWMDDESTLRSRQHILSCASQEIMNVVSYFTQTTQTLGLWRVGKWCKNLHTDLEAQLSQPPSCKPLMKFHMPKIEINSTGQLVYSEVARYSENANTQYVAGLREGFKGVPFTYIRDESGAVDAEATNTYFDCVTDVLNSGVSFEGKVVVVTGCGPGSIAIEIVALFLQAGAKVIATTSSFSAKRCQFYQKLYQDNCAKASSLVILPFNGGSMTDVESLVSFIYESKKDKGLGCDVDFVIPFAAISETGRAVDGIDSKSELAHRVMTTNVIRMMGEIKKQKAKRNISTRPAVVILPLSPNHGLFGYDGLYAESKLGLEALLNKRNSEDWADYLNVIGAVIGWTRGTGLMAGNNMTAPDVELHGCRTFSTEEMALNLFALAHSNMVEISNEVSVVADLGGGFAAVKNLNQVVTTARKGLLSKAALAKNLYEETMRAKGDSGAPKPMSAEFVTRARFDMKGTAFPPLPSDSDLKDFAPQLQGMIDLKQTVVITGFGEVGPWGSSRTRWEMEAFGEFSIEGCIELAWLTGRIRYVNTKLPSGKKHIGWVDTKSGDPVPEHAIKEMYEEEILKHAGIRIIEPELFNGYNPEQKSMLHQVAIDKPTQWLEIANKEEGEQFRTELGANAVDIRLHDGVWQMKLKKGAVLSIPKAMKFDRLVAGQIPTGWDAARYGIPDDIISQVDPITLYTLVSTAEALIAAGVPDPYEFYKYVHVSELGNTMGGGMGGMSSLTKMFVGRKTEESVQGDILQETFINTMPAWVNMLLLSSSGPIKTPVGACATAAESIDIAVETIKAGKARIIVCGGYDDFGEEGSYEFASMKATSNTTDERAMGREPAEMCRPTTSTRGGFMESHGAGVQILMDAELALKMGCPIYGIIALTSTATDKEGRSVPAPGQGILTTSREKPSRFPDPNLDLKYRRRNLEFELQQIEEWKARESALMDENTNMTSINMDKSEVSNTELLSQYKEERQEMIAREMVRLKASARSRWGNNFFINRPEISPLRGALSVWGLTVDDLAVTSFHGTGTNANDKNESQVTQRQMEHLGRTKGNPMMVICQKWFTGHPKGAAAAWMFHGLVQSMNSGIVPGNRNADNTGPELRSFDHLVYPNKSVQVPMIKAAMLKSFGFGQAGAEVVMVHPNFLFAAIEPTMLASYAERRSVRERKSTRYLFEVLAGKRKLFKAKTAPPYTPANETAVYTNPTARATYDTDLQSWVIVPEDPDTADTSTTDNNNETEEEAAQIALISKETEDQILMSSLSKGARFGVTTNPAQRLEEIHKAATSPIETAWTTEIATAKKAPPMDTKKMLEMTMRTSANNMAQLGDKGIGIDVEPVSTFKSASLTFIQRNFTAEEQSYCNSHANPAAGFAGRWAAKEAVIKAISSTAQDSRSLWRGGGAPLKEIAILPSPSGAPVVKLTGHALDVATALGVTEVVISISHAADHAVAQAVAR